MIKIPANKIIEQADDKIAFCVYFVIIKNKNNGEQKKLMDGLRIPSGWEYVSGNDACYKKTT